MQGNGNQLKSTKSLLAKLLATENITVSHLPVKSASFDINSRSLICPIWKDMDGDLYDLLLGREVGHALETPAKGWKEAMIDENGNRMPEEFEDCLSVLEDARIEKKIKRRYPGLSKSFTSAYSSLYEENYFGIKTVDTNLLNFIDRINIHSKIGSSVIVPWRNDWEREIVREVDTLETWKQVVELAKKIFDYINNEEFAQISTEDDLNSLIESQESQNDSEEEVQEETQDEVQNVQNEDSLEEKIEFVEEPQSSDQSLEEQLFNSQDELFDSQLEESTSSESETTVTQNETAAERKNSGSVTLRKFKNRESELINHKGKVYLLNLPEANLQNIIMKNEIVLDELERFVNAQLADKESPYGKINLSYDELAVKCVREFNSRNKKFIMHIFKEFDMRKKAKDYARTSVSRVGELDMNVLYKYKYSNDLFKKMTVVQKGKNHGLILFVDMSGSMQNIFRNTIEQTLVLVSFCKLANIPFEVYGFSNDNRKNKFLKNNNNNQFTSNENFEMSITPYTFHLKHLIGSSLKAKEYRRSFNALSIIVNEFNSYDSEVEQNGQFQSDWTNAGFGLHGTPYIETLLASRELIKQFKSVNSLDIVNVIYLTDGVGNTRLIYPKSFSPSMMSNSVIYFVDKKTQYKIRLDLYKENEQIAVTKLVKEITKCKHLGFYLVDKKGMMDILSNIRDELDNIKEFEKMRKSARENNFFSAPVIGYDKYFYVSSSNKNIQDQELSISSDMEEQTISNIFARSQFSKKNNRILVTKFAEELASGL